MKYDSKMYDILRQRTPVDSKENFSKFMREDMRDNRKSMLADIIDYLEKNKIQYSQNGFDVICMDMTISPNMKVVFSGSVKSYQYNYLGLIERIETKKTSWEN